MYVVALFPGQHPEHYEHRPVINVLMLEQVVYLFTTGPYIFNSTQSVLFRCFDSVQIP